MDPSRLPEDAIRIASTPPIVEKLTELVSHPDQIDRVSNKLGVPAALLNFHLASLADFSSIGLGDGIFIPTMIAKRRGGRKSLYYLNPGEEVLSGIFVTNQAIVLRYVGRVTGSGIPAQTGDTYSVRLTNREGQVIFQGEGTLKVTNALKGEGWIECTGLSTLTGSQSTMPAPSVFWSLF